ncbi:MAG: T9SS type A sorting domain-containing protein [Prevotellaceae bacterium]|jgi:hypothetical protein|nr:T9SS type A sorting domain-containing protein [Prevotellaceae bacterium]
MIFLLFHIILNCNIVCQNDVVGDTIVGKNKVCTELAENFSLSSEMPENMTAVWAVTNGHFAGMAAGQTYMGEDADIIFNQTHGSHTITVRFRSNDAPYCYSRTVISKTVTEVDNTNIQIKDKNNNIIAPNDVYLVCPSTSEVFNAVIPDSYENVFWELTSPNGQPLAINFGSISGASTIHPTLTWNNVSSGSICILKLTVTSCGQKLTHARAIQIKPQPVISTVNNGINICSNEEFNLNFTSSFALINAVAKSNILNEQEINMASNINGTSFSSANLHYQNLSEDNVQITIRTVIRAENICTPIEILSTVNIIPQPNLKVNIYNYETCETTNPYWSQQLYATIQNDLLNTTTEWFKVGSDGDYSVGTGNNITIVSEYQDSDMGFGQYYAVSTSEQGCATRSRNIRFSNNCPSDDPNCPTPTNSLYAQNIDCSTVKVWAAISKQNAVWSTPNSSAITIQSQNINEAYFNISEAGIYRVIYTYSEDGCIYKAERNIIKPVKPDIRYSVSCGYGSCEGITVRRSNNQTYCLQLYDNSVYMPEGNVVAETPVFRINGNIVPTTNYTYYIGNNATTLTIEVETHTSTLAGAAYPVCTAQTTVSFPAAPTAAFTVTNTSACPDEHILLQPTNINPTSSYRWSFENINDGLPVTNDLTTVEFMPPNAGYYNITLTERDKYGCEVTSAPVPVHINSNKLDGVDVKVKAQPASACKGESITLSLVRNVSGIETPYTNLPYYQWMNGNTEIAGANSPFYITTKSGGYWVKVKNPDGCNVLPTISRKDVEFMPVPQVWLSAPAGVCADCGSFELKGTISNPMPNMEYRWRSTNGTLPTTAWQRVINPPANESYVIERTIYLNPNMSFPNDTYIFEVRFDNGCTTTKQSTVVFNPPAPPPSVTYTLNSALYNATGLYEATINAATGKPGTYIWSNGMNGSTITVNHGGVYKVIFINEFGCKSETEIILPRDPKEYMWIVPERGCYTICYGKSYGGSDELYVLAPSPYVKFHKWYWLWGTTYTLSGSKSRAENNHITYPQSGEHSLDLTVSDNYGNDLSARSETFDVSFINCDGCNFKDVDTKIVKKNIGNYVSYDIVVSVTNSSGCDWLLTFSANPATDGFFVPASATLPAGSSQNYYLTYIESNLSNPVINLDIIAQSSDPKCPDCKTSVAINKGNFRMPAQNSILQNFSVFPNPMKDIVNISYSVENADNCKMFIYSASGQLIWNKSCNSKQDEIALNISQWAAGNYIVVFKQNNNIIEQKVLIKK